jgi:hypothetical protein
MGLPRVRFRVRHLMLVVAAIAVSLALVEEFSEGLPPRLRQWLVIHGDQKGFVWNDDRVLIQREWDKRRCSLS